MKIIAGLGNPGDKYVGTRHNVGYDAVDRIASEHGATFGMSKFKGLTATCMIDGYKAVLVKPLTYMNLSGECIRQVCDYYDVNLETGQLRLRTKGSAGGHNGLKSIISHVGDGFDRVRIGVGQKPPEMDLADFVLGHFPREELDDVKEGVTNAAAAAAMWLAGDFEGAQNRYNQKKKKDPKTGGLDGTV